MAQLVFRVNLQGMFFPLLSELSGRTVIVGDQDHTYQLDLSVPRDGQIPIDRALPQVYYAHNIMPSTYGYQSVGYDVEYSGVDWIGEEPAQVYFKSAEMIQAGRIDGTRPQSLNYATYFALAGVGAKSCFVLDPARRMWRLVQGAPDTITSSTKVTYATVNGVTYIYFSKIGAYIYDSSTNTLIRRTLKGLQESTLLGLVSSSGYLISYTETAIAWSSVVDVEDFEVSDVSGAGGGNVQEARGAIVGATTTASGILLFTRVNVVAVIFSGNADFPWNFRSIPSSGGVADSSLISNEQISGYYQYYSTNGLQRIATNGCSTIFPDVTDFISGRVYEDLDVSTGELTVERLTWDMQKSLAVVADRYLAISYGRDPNSELTHAIVVDVAQQRMGKLRKEHGSIFELRELNVSQVETPRGSLALLQKDGTILTVNFDTAAPAPDTALLLGKYQYVRQRWLELHTVECENIRKGADFSILSLPTQNGKDIVKDLIEVGYPLEEGEDCREFAFQKSVGLNVSLLLRGRFNLISLILNMYPHGGK